MNNNKILEIAQFKLSKDIEVEEFLKVSKSFVENFVKKQDGFINHKLCHNKENDCWADIVTWDSMDCAKKVSENIEKDEFALKYCSLLDFKSVVVEHFNIFS